LQGVVEYSKEFGPWVFYRMPIYYRELYGDKGVVNWAKKWKADAILAQFGMIDMDVLNELDIPIVVQNYRDRHKNVSNLTGDYYCTGMMAAEFFMKKGFRSFAYYGPTDTVWMRERGEGFREKVMECGRDVYIYEDRADIEQEKWSFNAEDVSTWLLQLPKPIALFACDDFYALQITEVCKMYNIDIPNEISILGVDNDDLLCSISDPNLSSIELDVVNGGYEAGRLLHSFILKKLAPPVDVIVKPIRIVERKSTKKYAVNNKFIEKLLVFIDRNYMDLMSVEDLVHVVPYSRRIVEKKFKEETGVTIYQYLQRIRIDKFSEFLITSDLPLVEAASRAGFNDYKNVSRVFTKENGVTPFQFRKAQQRRNKF
jgi:LacI family transcriptional regulator